MTCRVVRTKDGGSAIVCGPKTRSVTRCRVSGCHDVAVALCDQAVTRSWGAGTCDQPMCAKHRHPIAKDKDLCPVCWEAAGRPKLQM